MVQRVIAVLLVCIVLLSAGCSQTKIDFRCDVPGKAVVFVDGTPHELPATISFDGSKKKLRMELPTSGGRVIKAKGEIAFYNYKATDIDRYARLRAVLSRDLIKTVEEGGAAVFTGYSASEQKVFQLLFGKE